MTNKNIEQMKRNIDELVPGLKNIEYENSRMKETLKSHSEKIDSMTKEMKEEKGKTITTSDGAITMRGDMWKILNENNALKAENTVLKKHIKEMEDVCDGSCFSDEEDERNKMIAELQNKHQQDCIRINDLTTTVHVLAGLYSTLRKNVRMD